MNYGWVQTFIYNIYIKLQVKAITFHDQYKNKTNKNKINPYGLKNLGNTCFLNCVLQALSSCDGFKAELSNIKEKLKDESFTTELLAILQELRRTGDGKTHAVNPRVLFRKIIEKNRQFAGNIQQDALELFQEILCLIQHDRDLIQRPTEGFGQLILSSMKNFENNSKNQRNSSFEGLMGTSLICEACNHRKPVKYDTFNSISLPISGVEKKIRTNSFFYSDRKENHLSLYDCLDGYFEKESLDDILCPNCSISSALRASTTQKEQYELNPIINKGSNDRINLMGLEWLKLCRFEGVNDSSILDQDDWTIDNFYKLFYFKKSIQRIPTPKNYLKSKYNITPNEMIFPTNIKMYEKIKSNVLFYKNYHRHWKHMEISRFPSLLCLHLNRKLLNTSTGDYFKISSKVGFPLKLNMEKYFNKIFLSMKRSTPTAAVQKEIKPVTMVNKIIYENENKSSQAKLSDDNTDEETCSSMQNSEQSFDELDASNPIPSHAKQRLSPKMNNNAQDSLISNKIENKPIAMVGSANMDKSDSDKRDVLDPSECDPLERNDTEYDLIAVVVHHGTASSGHYGAYCLLSQELNKSKWIYASDEIIRYVDEGNVLNCEPYMLFYGRMNS